MINVEFSDTGLTIGKSRSNLNLPRTRQLKHFPSYAISFSNEQLHALFLLSVKQKLGHLFIFIFISLKFKYPIDDDGSLVAQRNIERLHWEKNYIVEVSIETFYYQKYIAYLLKAITDVDFFPILAVAWESFDFKFLFRI